MSFEEMRRSDTMARNGLNELRDLLGSPCMPDTLRLPLGAADTRRALARQTTRKAPFATDDPRAAPKQKFGVLEPQTRTEKTTPERVCNLSLAVPTAPGIKSSLFQVFSKR